MDDAPRPWDLTRVDSAAKQIDLPVILLGTAARDIIEAILAQTRSEGVPIVGEPVPDEASFTYLPLTLGDVRGWTTRLHLYGFGSDLRLAQMVGEYARAAAAGVLAFHEPPDENGTALVAVLARSIPPKIPVATLGPQELAKTWHTLHDTPPVMTATAEASAALPALKAIAKDMLAALTAP